MAKDRVCLCIDLKAFYASVECVERGLDPLNTNLVVADVSRTEKTICLAVSPSLKAYGISGRPRLFEVVEKAAAINFQRKQKAPGRQFSGESYDAAALRENPGLSLSYLAATPRMALYMRYSTRIYQIYLRYVAPEDIHVYSVDEVFMDITDYLFTYRLSAKEMAQKLVREVFAETGITATAGIGTNLYLAKVAMDIVAKRMPPDENGIRVAELDEMGYRRQLWEYRPITDFWRVGRGYAEKLKLHGMETMGDIARRSVRDEDSLYKMFGKNAELLIDHAWGWEPCAMADIKAYRPAQSSVSAGQVLPGPYPFPKAKLVVREMAEQLALDLAEKGLAADQVGLMIGYDVENLSDPDISRSYRGEIAADAYGRKVPKHASGTENLGKKTNSEQVIVDAVMKLFSRIGNEKLLVRRITVAANRVVSLKDAGDEPEFEQLNFFTESTEARQKRAESEKRSAREKNIRQAVLTIKKKYGKNAILKASDFEEGATAVERNQQIGGHKA